MSGLKKEAVAIGAAFSIAAVPSSAHTYFNSKKWLLETTSRSDKYKTLERKWFEGTPAPAINSKDKIEINIDENENVLESTFTSNYYVVVTNKKVYFASGCNKDQLVLAPFFKCSYYKIMLGKYGVSNIVGVVINPAEDTGYLLTDNGNIVVFTLYNSDGKLTIRNDFKERAFAIKAGKNNVVIILGKDRKIIGIMKSTYSPGNKTFSHKIVDFEKQE